MQRIERALLTLTACGGLLVLLGAGETAGLRRPATADTVKARRAAAVYSSPGEQSRVIARVRSGDKIRVLQRKNRWFQVRVKGRTGWIAKRSVARMRLASTRGRGPRRRPSAEGRGRRRGSAQRERIAAAAGDGALRALPDQARDELKQRAIVRQRILRRELELARAEELALVQAEQRAAAKRAGQRPPERRFEEAEAGGEPADAERPAGRSLAARPRREPGLALPTRGEPGPAPTRRVERRPLADAEAEALAIDGVAAEPVASPAAVRTRQARPVPGDTAAAAGAGMDDLESQDALAVAAEEAEDGVIIRESDLIRRKRVRASGEMVRETDPVARDDRENPLDPRAPTDAGPAVEGAGDDRDQARARERETVVVRVEQARLYQLPSARSEPVERAAVGSELVVLGRNGGWLKVQNQRGVAGWIPGAKVQEPRRKPPVDKLARRASAGVGYSAIGQTFASSSEDPRGAYSLSSGAAVLALGGEVVYASGERWRLAGDLDYRLTIAAPGIRYTDPESMAAVDIGFKRHQVDLGARAGYVLGGDMGMVAYGRVGFHYDNFRINDVSNFDRNLALLPSEVLTGVTVGAILDVPRLGAAWAARVRVDALPLLASRQQTTGLEDGATSKTFAAWGGALLEYAWDDTYKLSGEYQYAYARTRWNGAVETSMRPHMADSARRKDSAHLLLIGVGRSF